MKGSLGGLGSVPLSAGDNIAPIRQCFHDRTKHRIDGSAVLENHRNIRSQLYKNRNALLLTRKAIRPCLRVVETVFRIETVASTS